MYLHFGAPLRYILRSRPLAFILSICPSTPILHAGVPSTCFPLQRQVQNLIEAGFFSKAENAAEIASTHFIGNRVMKLELGNGKSFVLRIQSEPEKMDQLDDLDFETFAHRVHSHLTQPIPFPIKLKLTMKFVEALKVKAAEKRDKDLFEKHFESSKSVFSVSVLSLYPLKTGGEFIAESQLSDWEELSKDMREQLADRFSIHVALGIFDFHSGNWLTDGSNVLPIDLAFRTFAFTSGLDDYRLMYWSFPFPIRQQFDPLILVHNDLSPTVRRNLERLDAKTIKDLARESNFKITNAQIQGMLGRIKNFLTETKPSVTKVEQE